MLIITRGLPGSGKTTRATAWVAEAPTRRARVNRDDLRAMLHGGWLGTVEQETAVTAAADAAVGALLRAGLDVVADDTNLRTEHVDRARVLAARANTTLGIWDLTNVPVKECVRRDAWRQRVGQRHVGEAVIRAMWAQYLDAGQPASSGESRAGATSPDTSPAAEVSTRTTAPNEASR